MTCSHREHVLDRAYHLARANGGAAGVEGVTFQQVEQERLQALLAGKEGRVSTYGGLGVDIPKPNGDGQRPLRVPMVRWEGMERYWRCMVSCDMVSCDKVKL